MCSERDRIIDRLSRPVLYPELQQDLETILKPITGEVDQLTKLFEEQPRREAVMVLKLAKAEV